MSCEPLANDARNALVLDCIPTLHGICHEYRGQLVNGVQYDDLYSVALMEVAKSLQTWKPEIATLRTYVRRMAHYEIRRYLKVGSRKGFKSVGDTKHQYGKKNNRLPVVINESDLWFEVPKSEDWMSLDLLPAEPHRKPVEWPKSKWQFVLRSLPTRLRKVFKLYFVKGLTYTAIARQMKCSESYPRQLVYQAIRILKKNAKGLGLELE